MRKTIATLATAAVLGSGAVACSDAPAPGRDDCKPRTSQTAAKHRPPGGRSGGSRSRPRSNPKPKPPAHVPAYIDGGDCDDD